MYDVSGVKCRVTCDECLIDLCPSALRPCRLAREGAHHICAIVAAAAGGGCCASACGSSGGIECAGDCVRGDSYARGGSSGQQC